LQAPTIDYLSFQADRDYYRLDKSSALQRHPSGGFLRHQVTWQMIARPINAH